MPLRVIIGAMMVLTCIVNFMVRGNISLIILAMTEPLYNTTDPAPDYGPRYAWSAYEQGLVIGSYFWGLFATTFISGLLAERYGARKVVGIGVIVAAILSAVAPVSANYLWLSVLVRLCTGMAMSTVAPALQTLISNWAPPEEKGKFISVNYANGIGAVIDWSLSGFIIKSFGWQYAFYLVVVILCIFAVLWFLIIYDSPKNHPRITAKEKAYILSSLQTTVTAKKPWPPFKSMLLSIPIWALVIFHFGVAFSQYIFLTATPKYLSEVYRFDIASTGVLSSVPYLARFVFSVGFGFIGDYLFKSKKLSPVAIRKGFSIFSHFLPAFLLIGLSFVGNRPYLAIGLMSLALGFCGALAITSLQNAHDLSPNFTTTIFAVMHTFGSTPGFIAPLVVAHFTRSDSTEEEWRYVFLIGAGLLIGTAVIFILFGSVEIQKWNKIPDIEGKTETNTKNVDKFDIPSK